MAKTYKIKRGDLIFAVLLLFIVGFIAGTTLAPQHLNGKSEINTTTIEGEKVVKMGLPAVDSENNGVVGTLVTTIRPGSGQVLVNVNNVLAQFDTQLSGRAAAKAASNYTNLNLNNIDIIYDVQVNASIIEGPSAGASLATSIVLALENISSTNRIMITGTIDENGNIGKVGAIMEKAQAAKNEGAEVFLVPAEQGSQLTSTRTKVCKQLRSFEVCQVRYVYGSVNVGESLNMTVKEVNTLADIIAVYKEQSKNFDLVANQS